MKKIVIILQILLISACASNPSGIGSNISVCCVTGEYTTFNVVAKDIPAFLGPLMVSNFSVAFAGHGIQPVVETGDLLVVLSYEQTDLGDESRGHSFGEQLAPGGDVQFIARMVVDIRDAKTEETVWKGSIQKTHHVAPGEYMHTGRASIALLDAFNELLEGYPGTSK